MVGSERFEDFEGGTLSVCRLEALEEGKDVPAEVWHMVAAFPDEHRRDFQFPIARAVRLKPGMVRQMPRSGSFL